MVEPIEEVVPLESDVLYCWSACCEELLTERELELNHIAARDKPCPFCGSEDFSIQRTYGGTDRVNPVHLQWWRHRRSFYHATYVTGWGEQIARSHSVVHLGTRTSAMWRARTLRHMHGRDDMIEIYEVDISHLTFAPDLYYDRNDLTMLEDFPEGEYALGYVNATEGPGSISVAIDSSWIHVEPELIWDGTVSDMYQDLTLNLIPMELGI